MGCSLSTMIVSGYPRELDWSSVLLAIAYVILVYCLGSRQ